MPARCCSPWPISLKASVSEDAANTVKEPPAVTGVAGAAAGEAASGDAEAGAGVGDEVAADAGAAAAGVAVRAASVPMDEAAGAFAALWLFPEPQAASATARIARTATGRSRLFKEIDSRAVSAGEALAFGGEPGDGGTRRRRLRLAHEPLKALRRGLGGEPLGPLQVAAAGGELRVEQPRRRRAADRAAEVKLHQQIGAHLAQPRHRLLQPLRELVLGLRREMVDGARRAQADRLALPLDQPLLVQLLEQGVNRAHVHRQHQAEIEIRGEAARDFVAMHRPFAQHAEDGVFPGRETGLKLGHGSPLGLRNELLDKRVCGVRAERSRATKEEHGVMELSARNQLPGTIKSVKLGEVMAEVIVDVAGHEVVSAITRSSVERLGLQSGDAVTVVIKSTEVMLAK